MGDSTSYVEALIYYCWKSISWLEKVLRKV